MAETLPAILAEAETLTHEILEAGGEITPELEAKLALNSQELKAKIDAYGFVLDSIKARQEFILTRMAEWNIEAGKCERAIESIKERIKTGLNNLELPEIHGYEYTFRIQANPPSVIIDDEQKVPAEFITTEVKTTTKVSRKEILDAIKAGQEVPGVHIERSSRLVTKLAGIKSIDRKSSVEKL